MESIEMSELGGEALLYLLGICSMYFFVTDIRIFLAYIQYTTAFTLISVLSS
jgi:hypothetical protein